MLRTVLPDASPPPQNRARSQLMLSGRVNGGWSEVLVLEWGSASEPWDVMDGGSDRGHACDSDWVGVN
eukprot:61992-Rhodomonas_salina.2